MCRFMIIYFAHFLSLTVNDVEPERLRYSVWDGAGVDPGVLNPGLGYGKVADGPAALEVGADAEGKGNANSYCVGNGINL